jgi:hypothetical protein
MANSLLYKASVPFCPLSEADRARAAAGQSLAAGQKLHDNDAPQVEVGTAGISRGMKHCDSNEFPVAEQKGHPTFAPSSICHCMAIRAAWPMQRSLRPTPPPYRSTTVWLRLTFGTESNGGPQASPERRPPEHLFAAGYAACFGGSLDLVAKQKKKYASTSKVTARQRSACARTVVLG